MVEKKKNKIYSGKYEITKYNIKELEIGKQFIYNRDNLYLFILLICSVYFGVYYKEYKFGLYFAIFSLVLGFFKMFIFYQKIKRKKDYLIDENILMSVEVNEEEIIELNISLEKEEKNKYDKARYITETSNYLILHFNNLKANNTVALSKETLDKNGLDDLKKSLLEKCKNLKERRIRSSYKIYYINIFSFCLIFILAIFFVIMVYF